MGSFKTVLPFGKAPEEIDMEDITAQVAHVGEFIISTCKELTSSAFVVGDHDLSQSQYHLQFNEVAATPTFGGVDGAARLCSRILSKARSAIKGTGMPSYDGNDSPRRTVGATMRKSPSATCTYNCQCKLMN